MGVEIFFFKKFENDEKAEGSWVEERIFFFLSEGFKNICRLRRMILQCKTLEQRKWTTDRAQCSRRDRSKGKSSI